MLPEAIWVNQYDPVVLGMSVYVRGQLADPDGSAVTASMASSDTGLAVFSGRAATRVSTGVYEVQLTSADTEATGGFTITWSYAVSGQTETLPMPVEIGAFSPDYAALADPMRQIVESVWHRFADLFDSPMGGPNLQVYFQSHFTRGRMAQLLRVAMGILNTASQPYQTYTLDGNGGATFPTAQWGPLLEQALHVEVIKHLRRSYVEQPMLQGGQVTYEDRRDYMDRWSQVLSDEQQLLKSQLDTFKIASMGLGRPAVLVSGGAYGRTPGGFANMSSRGRPRYYFRTGVY